MKVYRAYQKELCYITCASKDGEDRINERLESGDSTLEQGYEVLKYKNHLHCKREAVRAKMMLHGQFPEESL